MKLSRFGPVPLTLLLLLVAGATTLPALAADDEVVSLVLQLLHEKDKELRGLGLDQVRTEAKGEAATRRFAEELPKLDSDGQVALLRALADRGDSAAREPVLELAKDGSDEAVRIAAICALSALGGAEDVKTLVTLLSDESKPLQRAARRSLERLRGETTPRAVAAALSGAKLTTQIQLIEILVARRAQENVDAILPYAAEPTAELRTTALAALGQLAGADALPSMFRALLLTESNSEREAAERAVAQVAGRIEDTEERDAALLAAWRKLDKTDQPAALSALARVGGTAIREVVDAALADQDAAGRRAGLRALCNWPDASAVPALLEIAALAAGKETPWDDAQRTTARAALIRLAPLPDKRSPAERLELVQRVMKLCETDAERNLLLKRARAIRTVETLRYLLGYLDQATLKESAAESIVELAHHRELREKHKDEFQPALERLIKNSQDATVVQRAERYLKNQTWAKPKPPEDPSDGGC